MERRKTPLASSARQINRIIAQCASGRQSECTRYVRTRGRGREEGGNIRHTFIGVFKHPVLWYRVVCFLENQLCKGEKKPQFVVTFKYFEFSSSSSSSK